MFLLHYCQRDRQRAEANLLWDLTLDNVLDKNPKFFCGGTLLHHIAATSPNETEKFKKILELSSDKNPKGTRLGDTPLHFAAAQAQWHFCSKFHPNLYKSSHGNVWGVERSRKDQGTGICCQIALFFSQNRINFEKPSKTILFPWVLVVFERFFKLYSILA